MKKSFKVLGNIQNIPEYQQWSALAVGTNTIANSPEFLQKAKIKGRKKVAELLEEQYGYTNSSVVGADPEDFSKWNITNNSVVQRISNLLGMDKPSGRVQILSPGAMVPLHVDDLRIGYIEGADQVIQKNEFTAEELAEFNNNPRVAARVLIMLEDWQHGQGVIFGDHWFDHWKRGDTVIWDWVDGVHATVNAGYWDRPLLRLSGLVTEKFLKNQQLNTPFTLDFNG